MSRSPEEIRAEHDRNYDAEIPRLHADFETWMLDFGSDAIFRVCFWNKAENQWSTYMGEYKLWQSFEVPGDMYIGWRPVEWDGMFNSIEYHLLSECQVNYYPPEKEDE